MLEAADGAGRQDALHPQQLEAIDVRPEIELGWQEAMTGAVAREERHAMPAQRAGHVRRRRLAERRLERALLAPRQFRHLVEAAAADDADACLVHEVCFNSTSTPPVPAGWTKAINDSSAPGRGSSSISLMPRALSSANAAPISSTRKVM